MTDGKDLEMEWCLEARRGYSSGGRRSRPFLESELFRNQTGCTNDIDLEGNLIKTVSFRMDYNTLSFPERNRTNTIYNFNVLFEGRALKPYKDVLAVVDFQGAGLGCSAGVPWIVDLIAREGPKWALQEHVVDFGTVEEN